MAIDFAINARSVSGKNTRFWQAAGDDLLYWLTNRKEGQDFLDRIVRTDSCWLLRNHHALSDMYRHGVHLSAECYFEDENGEPYYDFTFINGVYNEFVKRGIKPYVECDYYPAILGSRDGPTVMGTAPTTNRNAEPRDWEKWRNLVRAFVQNLVVNFGLEEVRTWYIEVWNEPDGWPTDDWETFYRVYDIFVDVVKGIDPELKVGGPAVFTQWSLQRFLEHITSGKNHVTGEIGTHIDFISYHQYAMIGGWADHHPLIRPCTQWLLHDMKWLQSCLQSYGLQNVEFHINEWGVCNNYYRTIDDNPSLEYRNTEFSALFLVKLVRDIFGLADAFDFHIAVFLFWGTAWGGSFDRMFYGLRSLMTAGGVPKPIQTGFEMLARLGDERVAVEGPGPGSSIGVIATRSSNSVDRAEFIIYNFNELDDWLDETEDVDVRIKGLTGKNARVSIYAMDNEHHNTYRAWQRQGSPTTVEETDIDALKKEGELSPDEIRDISIEDGTIRLDFAMKDHTMRLCVVETEE